MVQTRELLDYTNSLLRIDSYRDYCPNGLQVEGKAQINKLVSGVSATQTLLEAAIDVQADAILVHHGYFWKGENPCVQGMKRARLHALLTHEINLLAYHLPLDAHELYGNNVQLAGRLGIQADPLPREQAADTLVRTGTFPQPMSGQACFERIRQQLARTPLWIGAPKPQIHRVAWCTGAAQGYLEQAVELGVDAYITGEVSEQTVHIARECGVHFFAAGHHATERYGAQAVGIHLAERFAIEHEFIDIDNPV